MDGSTWDRGYVLLLGGARSGKSRAAVDLACASGRRVTFVATATASDDDMAERIRRHRAERPATWRTVDAGADALEGVRGAGDDLVVVDCLTLWTSTRLVRGDGEDEICAAASELARELAERPGPSIVVSNEVGLGLVPDNELGRRFRDVLGRVNTVMASSARRSVLLVAGLALPLAPLAEALV